MSNKCGAWEEHKWNLAGSVAVGQHIGLTIQQPWVWVLFWPLAGFVLGCPNFKTNGHTKNFVACKNILFSSLFAARDVSRGGNMSATQQQKFHTDDANQCLHNKSGSHGAPNINLSKFLCFLVDFGKVLCSSAKELQQNSNTSSREDYIPQILTVLLEILCVYIWPLWPFVFCLSCVNNG